MEEKESYKRIKRGKMDFWIFITILILSAIGTIMVFSSSAAFAYSRFGDIYYFLRRQIAWLAVGFGAMLFTANFDYRKYAKLTPMAFGLTIPLLIATLFTAPINGATRWLGPFQPSEVLKITLVMFLAYLMSKNYKKMGSFIHGFLPYVGITGVLCVILIMQPHFSAALILVLVTAIMMVVAGSKIRHFVIPTAVVVPAVVAFVMTQTAHIVPRVLSFVDPFADKSDSSWQIVQSLYAIGSGGMFGRGIGRSLQKYLYLPEPYNDFILSILAEELGFIGVTAVIFIFGLLIWRGFKVANNAPDRFGSLLAVGLTAIIAVQVVINIAVVTSSMPVTGMPLPFFSYGGTSLVFMLAGMGILLNISRYANYEKF